MQEFFTQVMSITIFGGFIWFAILSVLLFICLITSEVKENGYWATFYGGVFLAIFYFWGNKPLADLFTWNNVGYYIAIGFLYAVIRTFFFGRSQQQAYVKHVESKTTYTFIKKNLKDHIFRWWFWWPISLLTWIFTDLFKKLYDVAYQLLEKFFDFIVSLGEGTVKKPNVTTTDLTIRKNDVGDR